MDKQQILEREARYARRVGFASIAAVVLYLGPIIAQQAANLVDHKNDATQLVTFHDHATALLGLGVLQAIGALLLAAPFLYLFRAAQARSDRVRPYFIAFALIGPFMLSVQSIVSWVGLRSVSQKFVDQAGGVLNGNLAQSLITDSNALKVGDAIGILGVLGLLVGMVYISLHAMRNGLLTRFAGSVGIGIGASFLLLGFVGVLGVFVWILYVGLMIGGWLPSGRPPAWVTGEAMPWPRPGEESPAYLEATGREVPDPGQPELEAPEPEGASWDPEPAHDGNGSDAGMLAGTQGRRRKKRKRRS